MMQLDLSGKGEGAVTNYAGILGQCLAADSQALPFLGARGLGEYRKPRQAVEGTLIVDGLSQGRDGAGHPNRVGVHGAEGKWAEDAAEKSRLGFTFCGLGSQPNRGVSSRRVATFVTNSGKSDVGSGPPRIPCDCLGLQVVPQPLLSLLQPLTQFSDGGKAMTPGNIGQTQEAKAL